MNALDGWRQVRLGDVVDEVTVGHVGSMASEYRADGIPFLRSQNVRPFRLDIDDVKFIDEQFHARLSKSALRDLDIVTVRTGKPGATAVVPPGFGPANCSDLVITRSGPLVDPYWLSYYINSVVDSNVATLLVGAVQQHFNVGAMRSLKVKLPPRSQQRAIADVLSALDDKIAANTKLATAADALALTLVREASAGRTTVQLGTVARITMGSSPTGDSLNESRIGTVFYQGVRDFGMRFPNRRVWTTSPTRWAGEGDILLSVRAPVGKVNIAPERLCIGRGLAAVRSTADRQATLAHLMRGESKVWQPYEAEGTVFGSINRGQLHAIQIPMIDEQKSEKLETQIVGLETRIASALRENEVLSTIRDALLPALMSGRLTAHDAEAAVGSAVDGGSFEPEALASGTLW